VREERQDQIRNCWWIRNARGAEASLAVRSELNVDAIEGDVGAAMATTTGRGFDTGGVEPTVMSRSRFVFAVVSRQLSAQHDIDECIAAILPPGFTPQQAAAAGTAATKSTSATATAVANRCIVNFCFTI
jgi:hypothetical protein